MEFLPENPFLIALLATTVSGLLATSLGSVPVLFLRNLSEKVNNRLLSFAAGVMLAATVFSLLLPSISITKERGASTVAAVLQAIAALCIGGLTIWAMDRLIPHKHFDKLHNDFPASRLKKIWLFVFAIAIHNFPEGLSVGVASSSGNAAIGLGATIGIALQNIPEGLSVSVALHSQGYSRWYSFFIGALTGLVEVFGGIFGAGVLIISAVLLPWALAFAAGSMLFIVSDEIIPETHRPGLESGATAALFVGFGMMMFLDSVFAQ
ncbi:MAG TPA: ZIP family metal transporter [Pyrinomonadaceae bacterium]|jgi:ZIP family zinc transporter|nr:ZIP family metal transporter [Pyrinomonadaceae bacterium]